MTSATKKPKIAEFSSPDLKKINLMESSLDDIAYTMLRAQSDSVKEIAIGSYFGEKDYKTTSCLSIRAYAHHKMQWVMLEYIKSLGYTIFKETNYGYTRETPPINIDIETAPGKMFTGYSDVVFYLWHENADERGILDIHPDYDSGYSYYFYSEKKHDDFFQNWKILADKNNFYKGQKIGCDCRFLNLTDIHWEDVILETEKLDVIKGNITSIIGDIDLYKKYGISMQRGIILQGPPGTGKAQPLDAIVYTPNGPICMGDIKIGTNVISPNLGSVPVVGVYPQGEKDIYKMTFSDGDSVECCEEHLWLLSSKNRKHPFVANTKFILQNYKSPSGYNTLRIECSDTIKFASHSVPVAPYMLGILLGDGNLTNGCVCFSNSDQEIVESMKLSIHDNYIVKTNKPTSDHKAINHRIVRRKRSPKPTRYKKILTKLGLWGLYSREKFIPDIYKYNSRSVRLEILRGIMDTDGYVDAKTGMPEITICSEKLAKDIKEIVCSLGGICSIKTKYINRFEPCYRCFIRYNNVKELFKLSRKIKTAKNRTKYKVRRVISNIEYIGKKQAQCILVESKNHLYLTDNFVVTHNTQICRALAKIVNWSVLYALPADFEDRRGGIRGVCQMAKDIAPCVLFIEDIDWIAKNRDEGYAAVVMELMNQLDGLERFGDIITIGTTNCSSEIEKAVKNRPGRFDRIIEIGNPTLESRCRMISEFTKKFVLENVNVDKIAEKMEGLSGAHVKDLCKTAAMFAIKDRSFVEDGERLKLLQIHFKEALKEVKQKEFSTYQETQAEINRSLGFASALNRKPSLDEDDLL